MTQEEKQLLLKDITARLPYQPMCEFTDTEDDFCKTTVKLGYSLRDFVAGKIIIKPYLRPISSMTEAERRTYTTLRAHALPFTIVAWLDENMFDHRTNSEGEHLIESGIALEAPEGMYK